MAQMVKKPLHWKKYGHNGPGKTNDGLDLAYSSTGVTSTGYYCWKMCKEETSNVNKTRVERSAPYSACRILLNYAGQVMKQAVLTKHMK